MLGALGGHSSEPVVAEEASPSKATLRRSRFCDRLISMVATTSLEGADRGHVSRLLIHQAPKLASMSAAARNMPVSYHWRGQ